MNTKNFNLVCALLILECVIADRISELKCDELASVNTDSRSLRPHVMEIIKITSRSDSDGLLCPVTLISEDFVLTSASCLNSDLVPSVAEIKVRKLKLPAEEEYSDFSEHKFTVKRIIKHELYTPGKYINDIALMQLGEIVPYQNGKSIFRPACLWTDKLNPSNLYRLYSNDIDRVTINSITLTNSEQCTRSILEDSSDSVIQSHMCYNTSRDFIADQGSPVELKINNQYYIFGVASISFDQDPIILNFGPKVSHFVKWIESIVWPDYIELECGERKVKHRQYITYAPRPSYHGEFPWHVALYKNNQKYICGGTILNNRTILTAAHCVQDDRGIIPANRFTVGAGTDKLSEYPIEARNYVVEEVVVHQNYSRAYLENDIALLKLRNAIVFTNYIQPICISNKLDYNNITMGTVAGWGKNEQNMQSDILLQATLPIIDNFACRASNRDFFPNYLNDHNYCAGYGNGTSVCSGDSGGGMIFEYKSRWYIRGIVSLGVAIPNSDRCDVTQLVLFTSIPKLYDWIVEHLED